jgi:hypothetical protein
MATKKTVSKCSQPDRRKTFGLEAPVKSPAFAAKVLSSET